MFIFFIFMNSYHEIPISPNNVQPSAPPQYDETTTYDSTQLNRNVLHSVILHHGYSGPPNQNWQQEIEENQTASFAERKCVFFIFFSGFIIYLVYYLFKDAF
jgi:hypothetical protein